MSSDAKRGGQHRWPGERASYTQQRLGWLSAGDVGWLVGGTLSIAVGGAVIGLRC